MFGPRTEFRQAMTLKNRTPSSGRMKPLLTKKTLFASRSLPLGLVVIGILIFISNIWVLCVLFIRPPWADAVSIRIITRFAAITAVFPYEFYSLWLYRFQDIALYWSVTVAVASLFLLRLNRVARLLLVILMSVVLGLEVVTVWLKTASPSIVGFEPVMHGYFTVAVLGAYIGYLTLPEVRETFGESLALWQKLKLWYRSWGSRPVIGSVPAWRYYNLGRTYEQINRPWEAIDAYRKAVQAPDVKPFHWLALGRVLQKVGKYMDAIEAFKKAVREDPLLLEAYLGMAGCYQAMGCDKERAAALERASWLRPDDPEVLRSSAQAFEAAGRWGEARSIYEHLVFLNPTDVECLVGLARILEQTTEVPVKAVSLWERASRLKPDDVELYRCWGLAALRCRDHKKALAAFKRVLDIDPDDVQALYQTGFCYAMIGDLESAKRQWRKLRQVDVDLADRLRLVIPA